VKKVNDLRHGKGHHTTVSTFTYSSSPWFPEFESQTEGRDIQHIEEELKPGSVNWCHYTFAHEALACGATGPDLQPHRDRTYEVFGEEYWVYHLPVQMLVIATICKYQVVASHSYANFHSIDDLRQVLLDRHMERRGLSSIEPHLWKVYQDSSWEGSAPAILITSQRTTRSRDCTRSTPVGQ
jgi:hypothetical protein